MGDRASERESYQKAAEIADQLLARGIPVIGFSDLDMGAKIGIAFQLSGERAKYAAKLPMDEATVDRFEELYRVVA